MLVNCEASSYFPRSTRGRSIIMVNVGHLVFVVATVLGKVEVQDVTMGADGTLQPVQKQAKLAIADLSRPENCTAKARKKDYVAILLHGAIDNSSETGELGRDFDVAHTTIPLAFQLDVADGMPRIRALDVAIPGMCVGQMIAIVAPPALAFRDMAVSFPAYTVPANATVRYVVELLQVSDKPIRVPVPNMFADIDVDEDGQLSKEELLAHFKGMGRDKLPPGLMKQLDTDKDGIISWDEFNGPKGDERPKPKDELR